MNIQLYSLAVSAMNIPTSGEFTALTSSPLLITVVTALYSSPFSFTKLQQCIQTDKNWI